MATRYIHNDDNDDNYDNNNNNNNNNKVENTVKPSV